MLIQPTTEAEVAEAVLQARAANAPLAIEGGGTKRGLGRPVQTERTLSLRGLAGITLYEPAEMVIGARAGTPLAEVRRVLDERGQMLAFEPPDHRKLLGSEGEPTIGGLVACGLAGPRRVAAGGLRDSLIGVRFVNGLGEIIKNGGRVMKNVTGLDLVKLQAGAYGTLGVLTEVVFKVTPKPAGASTLVFEGLSDADGVAALAAAMGSPFEPTGAAHIPSADGRPARTCIRIEGFPEQIAYRSGELRKRLTGFGAPGQLDGAAHDALWRGAADGAPLSIGTGDAVWRVSVPPSSAVAVVQRIKAVQSFRHFYDWSGGLVWIATAESGDAGAAIVQSAAADVGGHATLVRGTEALRAGVPVFQPLDPAVQKLQAGLKASFDPDGILNPGRMYAGL